MLPSCQLPTIQMCDKVKYILIPINIAMECYVLPTYFFGLSTVAAFNT